MSYQYYSKLSDRDNNKVWTSGIALVGCVLEVLECKYIITWCIEKFIQNRRTIPLQRGSLASLAPLVFKKILKLSESNLVYKGEEARNFLKGKNNGIELYKNIYKIMHRCQKKYPRFG
jgi:hypothetical protein